MGQRMLYRNLSKLIVIGLIVLTGCTPELTGTEPIVVERVNRESEQATAEPAKIETIQANDEQVTAEVGTVQPEPLPSPTATEVEAETVNTESGQATGEVTPTQPASLLTAVGEELQVLVAMQDDSLALWQDGTLNRLADTAGVFATVFVGNSGNIAYVREHEIWCVDIPTQAQQVPLPPELVAAIPYEYEAPDNILWLTSLGNSSQIVGTVFHGTSAYGTILVDCDSDTSQLIESANPGYPVVAPDGRKIAIAGNQAISVYDIASGVSRVLLMFEPVYTYTEAGFYSILSWSSDSTHVVTVIHPQDWWIEDVDEPSIVYRLGIESNEVEAVTYINRMFPREPHAPVPFALEKLAYSTPADSSLAPLGIIPTKQMILDLINGEETLLFEDDDAGFISRSPLGSSNGFTGWNPAGDHLSFWEGSYPSTQKIGVYDMSVGDQLEQRLPGTFAGWLSDTSFLYTADGTLYHASIVGSEITSSALTENIERVHQARVIK